MTSAKAVRRRTARLAAPLLPAVLLLTACGIPTSGVVSVGEPATGIRQNTVLYFVHDDNLTALPDDSGPSTDLKAALASRDGHAGTPQYDVELAVWRLADGPGRAYESKGVTSEFRPGPQVRPAIRVAGSTVTIELLRSSEPMSAIATRQLLCTAADAFLTVSPHTEPAELTVKVTGHAVWHADAFDKTCS